MQNEKMSRRSLLKWMGAGSATLALAACAPAPAGAPAAQSGGQAAPAGAKVDLAVATFDDPLHDWQREFAKRWADKHTDKANVSIEKVVYAEMPKLQLARSASGTLWDVVFSGIKWYPYSASKGMFLQLDDFIANHPDIKMDDFFPPALTGTKLDGKTFGLPYEIHPGNPALVIFNVDMLDAKGLKMPTDDWTVSDYTEIALKLNDPDKKIYGTNYLPGNYYDFESLARAYGTDIMDPERKQLLFATDEKNKAAAQFITDLYVKHKVAPPRAETTGVDFTAGVLGSAVVGTTQVNGMHKTIADKFKHDWVLFPKGPDGKRGYTAFTSNFSASSKTKAPDLVVDMIIYLTSEEAGKWSALEQGTGQPNARKSVWGNEELLKKEQPIFSRVLAMFNDANIPGPFPMPYNLRFQELQDNWANTSPDLFYGDAKFEEGLQKVQDAMQEILDLPRA